MHAQAVTRFGKVAVKHQWFEKELIAASGVTTLEEAAPQWELSHFDVTKNGVEHCQVCHTPLMYVAVIHNKVNGVYLRIGHSCYDKLVLYLKTKQVLSVTLSSRSEYRQKIRRYITDELGELFGRKQGIFAAMTRWFESQERLPEIIGRALACIKHLGHTLTLDDACEFVEYYKMHRLFLLEDLLTGDEQDQMEDFPHLKLLPTHVTIAALPKLRRVLTKGCRLNARRAERSRIAREKVWQEERVALARGVALENVYVHQHGDKLEVRFQAVSNRDHSYRSCFVVGGRRDSISLEEDLIVTVPSTARFAAPLERPWQTGLTAITVEMHVDDSEAWIARAQSRSDARVLKAQHTAMSLMERLVDEKPHLYIQGTLREATHPRSGAKEWQLRLGGEKFILQYGDTYTRDDGAVYFIITKELARNRVYVVARLHLDTSTFPYKWYYHTYFTGNVVSTYHGRHGIYERTRFVRNKRNVVVEDEI